jgi:energy-coupling factor transporter ATP-binding protein EcfA2
MDSSAFQVSGGQMKRLGIAMELLVDPDILLLDEPTSGLSSEDSHRIIYLLRSLAYNNKIVVATVHQPDFDIFMMFDKVLIIDEDGYSVYFGSPALASDYLRLKAGKVDKNSLFETRFNPAILLKLLDEKDFDKSGNELTERRISPKQYYDWFRENNAVFEAKSRQVDKKKSKKQNPFLSFFNHIKFSLQVDFKHKSGLILLLAIPIIIGMGFSFLTKYSATENYTYYYNPNIPVWILILLTSSVFIGLVSSGHAFIQLRLFFRNQDRIVNKSFSNTSAVIVKYLVLSILQSLLLVTPSVMIMENSFHFVNLFLICFVLVYWGSLVGLLLSKFFKTTNIVYLTIPLVIIPQLVFSGALIHFDSFNKISQKNGGVPFIADFVPLRWASEAVIVDFCNNNPYDKQLLKNRQTLYNAVYYLDYFIPAFEEIAVISADRGKKILDNEQKKAGMVILSQDFNKQIENTKEYYAKVISKCIVIDDSIFANMENAENLKLSCSNLAIEKVINNYESGNGLEVCNEEIVRIYKPIFSLPNDTQHNKLFLSAFGEFGMCWLPKYYFNVVVLCLYNLIIILSLYFVTCVQSKKLSQ